MNGSTMRERILCLYVPHFRVVVERGKHPALAGKLVVVFRDEKRPTVVEACARAEAAGVRQGMLLSRALSLCPRAAAVPADDETYGRAHASLLRPLLRLSPEVEVGELGLAYMYVRGLERLVGDERAVASVILGRVRQGGFPARVGIAGSKFAAEWAARSGRGEVCIVRPGGEAAFLAPLPVDVLPARDGQWREIRRRLRLLGIRTLGQVAKLGRVAMQAQFGAAGLEAWRMASGEAQPLHPMPVTYPAAVARRLEMPLRSWSGVEAILGGMAAELALRLRREGWACVSLQVRWQLEGQPEESACVTLKEPNARAASLLAAARRCLVEVVDGPLVELSLQAQALAPAMGKQMHLFAGREREARLRKVAMDLRRRLGERALCRVQFLGSSHLEERTYDFVPL